MERKRLSARLQLAAELGGRGRCAADIGCDHGLLAAYLIGSGSFERVIGVDISAPSLQKARFLAERLGLSDCIETRLGDGLTALSQGEADTLFILGMGDELIASLLNQASTPLMGAKRAVLSPMRGAEMLRCYLYERDYRIEADRFVRENGRIYQVFSVLPPLDGTRDALPDDWDADCFAVGYRAFMNREPLLTEYLTDRIHTFDRKLRIAKGSAGEENLLRRREALARLLRTLEEDDADA